MKLAVAHAFTVIGSIASLAMADQVSTQASGNITVHGGSSSTMSGCHYYPPPANGLGNWYYNSKAEGPYMCTTNHDTQFWGMLAAYRSGGTQGVHWKYTDDPGDLQCMMNWDYYTSDGQTIIESRIGITTFNGDTRRWCALPVYRSGGVVNKQWAYCLHECT